MQFGKNYSQTHSLLPKKLSKILDPWEEKVMHDTSISTVTPSETGTVKTQVFSLDASINSLRQVLPETRPGVPSATLPVTRRWRDQVMNVVPELNLPKTANFSILKFVFHCNVLCITKNTTVKTEFTKKQSFLSYYE